MLLDAIEFKVLSFVLWRRRRDTAGHIRTQGKVGGESKWVSWREDRRWLGKRRELTR